jgi:hypothetical protein
MDVNHHQDESVELSRDSSHKSAESIVIFERIHNEVLIAVTARSAAEEINSDEYVQIS